MELTIEGGWGALYNMTQNSALASNMIHPELPLLYAPSDEYTLSTKVGAKYCEIGIMYTIYNIYEQMNKQPSVSLVAFMVYLPTKDAPLVLLVFAIDEK